MLEPKQLEAIVLLLQGNLTKKQIAEKLDLCQHTVTNWCLHNEEFKEEYKNRINEKLNMACGKAAAKLIQLIESENENIALKASSQVLDRAGFSSVNKIEQVGEQTIIVDFIDTEGNAIDMEEKGENT